MNAHKQITNNLYLFVQVSNIEGKATEMPVVTATFTDYTTSNINTDIGNESTETTTVLSDTKVVNDEVLTTVPEEQTTIKSKVDLM